MLERARRRRAEVRAERERLDRECSAFAASRGGSEVVDQGALFFDPTNSVAYEVSRETIAWLVDGTVHSIRFEDCTQFEVDVVERHDMAQFTMASDAERLDGVSLLHFGGYGPMHPWRMRQLITWIALSVDRAALDGWEQSVIYRQHIGALMAQGHLRSESPMKLTLHVNALMNTEGLWDPIIGPTAECVLYSLVFPEDPLDANQMRHLVEVSQRVRQEERYRLRGFDR